MPSSIILSPSNNKEALVKAIQQANTENRKLILKPGTHLTMPGHNNTIEINENGLEIKSMGISKAYPSIKRPNRAIDLNASDSNYGLFFIPSKPINQDWAKMNGWKTHTVVNEKTRTVTTFQYKIIMRGKIKIENIEIDCNMGNQALPVHYPSKKIEHSAMLGFAGYKYRNPAYPGKFIFVGFESITLKNLRTRNGGYADDIWFSRGYFRPNISKVVIENVTSDNYNLLNPQPRVNNKRSTITFSGLTQEVEIKNTKVHSLQAEETSERWQDLPGIAITQANRYSKWKLKNIKCHTLDLAAKGKAIFLNAQNIETTAATKLYQLGGSMVNCVFKLSNEPTRLNRMNKIVFKNVTWKFTAYQNSRGYFWGIVPRADKDESCEAKFWFNNFTVEGNPIINSETLGLFLIQTSYSPKKPLNKLNLEFLNCTFDSRFGTDELPGSFIAKVNERGDYRFRLNDFTGRPLEHALKIKPGAEVNTEGNNVKIIIT